MTGIELAIQLNRHRPGTKILLISGIASGTLVLNKWLAVFAQAVRDFLSEQPAIEERLPGA